MNTTASKNLVMLARMLERLDRSAVAVDPQQYRGVVEHLSELLLSVPHDAALEAVLAASPATAELYENLQYQHAGLCRAPLEAALNAELAARAAIDAARKTASQPKA
jgi:ferritin-like metal-binding protein YciE